MEIKLLENKSLKETRVTIECKETNEKIFRLVNAIKNAVKYDTEVPAVALKLFY